MNKITIKSNILGRVRLKSKFFTEDIIKNMQNNKNLEFLHIRFNKACYSVIINYDYRKITLEKILEFLSSQIDTKRTITNKKPKTKTQICSFSCNCCEKYDSNDNLKKKALNFLALSGISAYIFIKEHILLTALNPVTITGVGVLSAVLAIPFLKESLKDIKNKTFSLKTFISFALSAAILGGEVIAAFEIIYILKASMLFEEYTAEKSKKEIRNLINFDNKKAYILQNDLEIQTDIKDIKKGDIVVCRSGEKIVVDGIIIQGSAEIDESIINGRSESVFKTKNDSVFSNTIVEKGRIYIKTNATGSKTYISKIINQVEKHLSLKSPSEIAADKLAKKVLKLGSILTATTLLATGSLLRAFSVMIVMSCPCSTVLAASSAISAAIAKAAKDGILIKGGKYLEYISQSEVFCFDKTGTLTTGKPVLKYYRTLKNIDKRYFFHLATSAEYHNTHPLAIGINQYAKNLGVSANENAKIDVIPGSGVCANINGDEIIMGNLRFMQEKGIDTDSFDTKKYIDNSNTIVYLAKNGTALGFMAFEHEVRDHIKEVVKGLKKRGVKKIILLTGDEEKVAQKFAKNYGFDEVYSELMPDDKAKIVSDLSKKYKKIVMIGDGINDTLAMSKANVGISFASGGSEAAIEVSNIAITNSEPIDILKLYDLSKFALDVVEQNYKIGMSTNILGSLLGSFGILSPAGAGLVHIAHTAGIIANSSRISISYDNDVQKILN